MITGLFFIRHFSMIFFCQYANCSIGISTPRSPLATISASAASTNSSMLSKASLLSIFATTIALIFLFLSSFLSASISFLVLLNERATKSTLFTPAMVNFFRSSSIREGRLILTPGKLTPFLCPISPPSKTNAFIFPPETDSTLSSMLPSSTKI